MPVASNVALVTRNVPLLIMMYLPADAVTVAPPAMTVLPASCANRALSDPIPVADESLIDAEPPLNFTVPAETFTLFNDVVPIISSVPSPVFTVREVSVALLRDVVVPDGTS